MRSLIGLLGLAVGSDDSSSDKKVPQVDDRENPLEPYPILVGGGNELFCLRATDGGQKWKKKLGETSNSLPIISYENVAYVTADDDSLYAYDVETGKRLWRFEADGPITVSGLTLAKDEKMIFLPTMDGTIYGLNIEDEQPQVVWKYSTNGEVEAPVVHDMDRELLYVTAMNELDEGDEGAHAGHDLYGINPADGSLEFKTIIEETVAFPVYPKGDVINLLTYNHGHLYQFERETGTGEKKGDFTPPSDAFPVLDQSANMLYFGYQTGGLGAIDLTTFKLAWSDGLDEKLVLTGMTLCAGKSAPDYEPFKELYFGTADEVVKYDVLRQEIAWTRQMKAIPALGAPVIDNWSQLLVSTEGGQTFALNSETGEEIWSAKTGAEVLYGLAIPEDYQDPRCGAATIHFMDEMVMMDKIFDDMFDDDGDEGFAKMTDDDKIKMEDDEDEDQQPINEPDLSKDEL